MRNEKGQFVKGQTGNPNGRPPKKREDRYLEITTTTCTFEEWKAVVKRAVADAKRGDAQARKWLSDYLVGPPVQRTENKNIDMTWQDFVNQVDDWEDEENNASESD